MACFAYADIPDPKLFEPAPVAGEQATLTFTTPPLIDDAPAAGDLVAFGEFNRETLRVLVRDIEPRPERSRPVADQPTTTAAGTVVCNVAG